MCFTWSHSHLRYHHVIVLEKQYCMTCQYKTCSFFFFRHTNNDKAIMSPIQILFSGNRTTAIVKWRIKINSMIIPLFYLLECNRIHYLLVFHDQLLTRPCEVPTSTCTFVYRNTCELPSIIIKINSFCLYLHIYMCISRQC